MHRLFVYGSLRRGESHHHLLADATFEAASVTPPCYRLLHLGAYPGLLPNGTTAVVGEVYAVSAALCTSLDAYEGHPLLFERRHVALADGSRAETYFLVDTTLERGRELLSGDWRQRF